MTLNDILYTNIPILTCLGTQCNNEIFTKEMVKQYLKIYNI